MRRIPLLCAAIALLLTGCVPQAPSGADPAGPTESRTLTIDGGERRYMFTPAEADNAPLVLMLHGSFGSAEQAREAYHWDETARSGGFAVAYADGTRTTWNAGECCGPALKDDVDDVAFLTALVEDVIERDGIDPDRVYVTGMSNGAMMAYRLACETDLFAAAAPVAGTLVTACDDPTPTSLLHIHGEEDSTIPIDGSAAAGGRVDGIPIADGVALFRAADGCEKPTTVVDGPVTTTSATCPDGRDVRLITVADAGHQWPGSEKIREKADEPSTAFDATELIWEFFEAHPRT